jgi:hypothetical protein
MSIACACSLSRLGSPGRGAASRHPARRRAAAILPAAAVLLAAAFLAAGTGRAAAAEITARVVRSNVPSDTRLYIPFAATFTADSPEAVLILSRPADDCAAGAETCTADTQCASGVCRSGLCRYPESVQVGYVAVVRLARYCIIAACGPNPLPAFCGSAICGGSSCPDPASDVNGLCLCSDCSETDPVLSSFDAPFAETFGNSADARWTLSQASIVTGSGRSYLKLLKPTYSNQAFPDSAWVDLAHIRIFGLQSGEIYVLVLKWTSAPYPTSTPCPLDDALTIHLQTEPAVCAP